MIRVVECLYEFIYRNFHIGNSENRIGCDCASFMEWKLGKLAFKCRGIRWRDFDKQASVDFSECSRCFGVKFHAKASTDAHLCGSDGESTFTEVMRGFDQSVCDGLMQSAIYL